MTRISLLASMLAGLLFSSFAVAEQFQPSPRLFKPIASSQELVLATAGPRFHGLDGMEGRDRLVRVHRDCRPGPGAGQERQFVTAVRFCAG